MTNLLLTRFLECQEFVAKKFKEWKIFLERICQSDFEVTLRRLNDSARETWCQFHKHLTSTFFIHKCFAQLLSNYSLALQLFGAKAAHKMLVKLTTFLNFATILWSRFFVVQLFCA